MSYMVIFKLSPENEANREALVELIKTFEPHTKISDTAYLIYAQREVYEVYAQFQPLIKEGDFLYVIRVVCQWEGVGDADITHWLRYYASPLLGEVII